MNGFLHSQAKRGSDPAGRSCGGVVQEGRRRVRLRCDGALQRRLVQTLHRQVLIHTVPVSQHPRPARPRSFSEAFERHQHSPPCSGLRRTALSQTLLFFLGVLSQGHRCNPRQPSHSRHVHGCAFLGSGRLR